MKKHSFKRFIFEMESLVVIAAVLLLLFSIFGYINKEYFVFDLFSHFRVQYLVISFFFSCYFLVRKGRKVAIISALTFLLNVVSVYPYISFSKKPLSSSLSGSSKLTFMVSNVLTSNNYYDEVIKSYKKVNPDFLVILEIDKNWDEHLEVLEGIYPYRKRVPRRDNFGIALFSKYPFNKVEIKKLANNMPPLIMANVEVASKEISIIGVHPVPPASAAYFNERNKFFRLLSLLVHEIKEPTVVFGDLNTTMWSYSFREFIKTSSLIDTRKDFGLIPTWPNHLRAFYIPLEHILISSQWQRVDLYSKKVKGSDHLALVAELSLIE